MSILPWHEIMGLESCIFSITCIEENSQSLRMKQCEQLYFFLTLIGNFYNQ